MDIRAISEILPHRYPFLLIDRVIEQTDDKVVAWKCVSGNELFFQGHFPDQPVMPGVLILEALAQTGAILACKATSFDPAKQVIYFLGIDKAKFRKTVVPGDRLELTVTPIRRGGAIWKMRGEARVEGALACECEFLATIVARDQAAKGASPDKAAGG
jgi:3-hydroxyacyl-[acyl-carrier-protein] dehydratase